MERAKIIANQTPPTEIFFRKWACYYEVTIPMLYCKYKYTAKRRSIEFELTEEEYVAITRKPCYLCGKVGQSGIDRYDSNKSYNILNARPCCYSCNISKSDFSYDAFLLRNLMIANLWKDTSIISLPVPTTELPTSTSRKHWKAPALYASLLDNTGKSFLLDNAEYVTQNELQKLKADIICMERTEALHRIRVFINTIKIRRSRRKLTVAAAPDTIQHIA